MNVLVTGSNGFIGSAVVNKNVADGYRVSGIVRRTPNQTTKNLYKEYVVALAPDTDFSSVLTNQEVIVHTAARVHVMHDTSLNPALEYRNTNVLGTLNLARQAASAGVRRFIFISSIKVNGEATFNGTLFKADDTPAPLDSYSMSKMEAEEGLLRLAAETGMEVVIVRPPLVYGPGVKANFLSMMRWLYKGIPLPLGAIHNKRSMVALDNLVSLIGVCLNHPNAANQVFLVSDGEDLSTTDLLKRLGSALGKPARLLPIYPSMLTVGAALLGKKSIATRLCGSLQVDIAKNKVMLGWVPPFSVDEALCLTASHFINSLSK